MNRVTETINYQGKTISCELMAFEVLPGGFRAPVDLSFRDFWNAMRKAEQQAEEG